MGPKRFSERILVATSQYYTTEFTRKLHVSLKKDNLPFTFLVVFDGTPQEKAQSISDIVDIALVFKRAVHSMPEIWNSIFNLAKSTDAEYLLICDNDIEFKEGSFGSMIQLIDKWEAVSPVKIDKDVEKFKSYHSNDDPVEVIGFNDSVWFLKLDKVRWNPENREYGPFGFEDVPFVYQLWKDGVRFVVDPKAVVFHHCSQDTLHCFNPEDRERYSKEWDTKRDYFLKTHGPDAEWFFDNVVMNKEAIKRFGYPVYIR